MASFRTGELEKGVDKMEEDAAAAETNEKAEEKAAAEKKEGILAKGKKSLMASFRTGELEKVVDKMEEENAAAESSAAPADGDEKKEYTVEELEEYFKEYCAQGMAKNDVRKFVG